MREQLVAWAEDCRLRGEVDLGGGRISDEVNERELLTFHAVTLEALEDGREVAVDEVEVERRELHLIEVVGHEGDPVRRLRTIAEPVRLEVGPYRVTGSLHRSPAAQPLAALSSWHRFVPVTAATIDLRDGSRPAVTLDVVLVNRERVTKYDEISTVPVWTDDAHAEALPIGTARD